VDQLVPQVHVLVVDDSVVMRRVIARALERDPLIARTEFAAHGRVALAKIAQHPPDVVVLDLEMPELDGFGTLAEIRRLHPRLPVVVFSSVDERSAAAALEALSLGATDFVVKPTASSLEAAEAYVSEHLAPVVKALAAAPVSGLRRQAPAAPAAPAAVIPRTPVSVIVIAVSTGGPDALHTLVSGLPAELRVPVLIVQHMPPLFTRLLAERLDRACLLRVCEAEDGEQPMPGGVYLAPGDHHLSVTRNGSNFSLSLGEGPPENSCRPAADVLFRTAAGAYGSGVLAVVLTGMGRDGLRGCAAVRAAGGQVVVQDPDTAVIGSMPAAVADAGLAHAVLPLVEVAPELVARVRGLR
jgi:two-component system chemotaxis response regulator CheB